MYALSCCTKTGDGKPMSARDRLRRLASPEISQQKTYAQKRDRSVESEYGSRGAL